MKKLESFKEDIHRCSKCGLCQAECPIYKTTGNDCTVSRGLFVMLSGVLKKELKLSKKINHYLDLCLKCGKCTQFCPSGIDIVDIVVSAKSEYIKYSITEKIKTFLQKYIIFGLIPNITSIVKRNSKSKKFSKKVLYFGGCSNKFKTNKDVIKILNSINIEVITPNFQCCGIPYFTRGDIKEFNNSIQNYINNLKKYNIDEIITTCASCEKSLKDYAKWVKSENDKTFLENIKIKNIYEYLKESNISLTLKKKTKVTYHKPCNITNFRDIEWLLKNTKNLEYIEMNDYDECCGLNGLSKLKNLKIMSKIFKNKRNNIINTSCKTVLTSCLGCETALKIYSFGKYKTYDFINFLAKNIQ